MQLYLYLLDDIDTQPININGMGGRTLRHAKIGINQSCSEVPPENALLSDVTRVIKKWFD